jgi:hypothetical protein
MRRKQLEAARLEAIGAPQPSLVSAELKRRAA